MRFKIDEDLPPTAADLLRGLGHDVSTVYDQGLQACTDPAILTACQGGGGSRFRSISTPRISWCTRRRIMPG
ncbi:DUF5615 family PIN-like protein [Aquisphaera giovannonii]|uniref:DUF5615 family PIN-like protein n=1 Tax=Aquisphaera giovannonii TaxID=406548 RepID=UPI00143DEF0D